MTPSILKNSAFILPSIFMVVGALIVGFGVSEAFTSYRLQRSGLQATGSVVDVQVKTEYDKNGKKKVKHSSQINFTDSTGRAISVWRPGKRSIGELVPLVYLAEAPEAAKERSNTGLWGGPVMLSILGLALTGGSLWGLIYVIRRQKKIEWLILDGEKVSATIVGIVLKERLRRSSSRRRAVGGSTYGRWNTATSANVIAEATVGDINRRFKSDSIDRAVPEEIVGRKVTVHLDPDDPESYYVDLDTIEEPGQSA